MARPSVCWGAKVLLKTGLRIKKSCDMQLVVQPESASAGNAVLPKDMYTVALHFGGVRGSGSLMGGGSGDAVADAKKSLTFVSSSSSSVSTKPGVSSSSSSSSLTASQGVGGGGGSLCWKRGSSNSSSPSESIKPGGPSSSLSSSHSFVTSIRAANVGPARACPAAWPVSSFPTHPVPIC